MQASINPMETVIADDGSIWKIYRERHGNGWTAVVVMAGDTVIPKDAKGVWYSTALNHSTVVTEPVRWIDRYVADKAMPRIKAA